MAWESYNIEQYEINIVAPNTADYTDIYGFIILYWRNKQRAKLWFYRDDFGKIPPSNSFSADGYTNFYARYPRGAFQDCVELLRHEKTKFFHWNEATKGVFLSSGNYLVGQGLLP